MFRKLMGLEPLRLTNTERQWFINIILVFGMVSALMPAAHRALGLPTWAALTVQGAAIAGMLGVLIWVLKRSAASR